MRFLRQSTQQDIVIGPVWSTSDYTAKTDLAYNASGINVDVYKVGTKADVTLANSAGDGYWRASAAANGYYIITLATGAVDTVGRLRVTMEATGYASAPADYTVLAAAVYDVLFGTTSIATSADVSAVGTSVTDGTPQNMTASANTLDRGTAIQTDGTSTGGTASTFAATYIDNASYLAFAPLSSTATVNGIAGLGGFEQVTVLCGAKRASQVTINGAMVGNGRYCNVYAYNYVTAAWDQISDNITRINGAASPSDANYTFNLLAAHQKNLTAGDGEVKVGFGTPSVTTNDRIRLDQILVKAVAAGPTAADIAQAVWSHDLSTSTGLEDIAGQKLIDMDAEIDVIGVDTGTTIPAQIGTPMQAGTAVALTSAYDAAKAAAAAGAAMALTSDERNAVAVAVESHILDEDDSKAVLAAIIAKIEASDIEADIIAPILAAIGVPLTGTLAGDIAALYSALGSGGSGFVGGGG